MSRVLAVLVTASVAVLVSALPAAAHVTVSSTDAAPGGFGKLVFRVPNESDTAGTVGLTVHLPVDTPFAFVSVKPKPGWAVTTTTTKLDEPVTVGDLNLSEAVTAVTWTARGATDIAPGEFDEFEISAGPFPEGVDSMSFPAEQTYDDGEVVSWSQPVAEGEEEPDLPAPTLDLGSDQAAQTSADDRAAEHTEPAGTAASSSEDQADPSDTVARTLGAVGVGLGAVAVLVASLRRRS